MLRWFSLALAIGASALLLGAVYMGGGRDTRPKLHDLTTLWVSSHGFTINIRRDGRYTFCDGELCFTDR